MSRLKMNLNTTVFDSLGENYLIINATNSGKPRLRFQNNNSQTAEINSGGSDNRLDIYSISNIHLNAHNTEKCVITKDAFVIKKSQNYSSLGGMLQFDTNNDNDINSYQIKNDKVPRPPDLLSLIISSIL